MFPQQSLYANHCLERFKTKFIQRGVIFLEFEFILFLLLICYVKSDEAGILYKNKIVSIENSSSHRKYHLSIIDKCPHFCNCARPLESYLHIYGCTKDPGNTLDNILKENVNVTQLSINNSFIKRLPEVVCKFTNLMSLNLQDNYLKDLPWECLKDLPALAYLDLKQNKFEVLKNGSFYGFRALRSLIISENNIRKVDFNVFFHLEKIPNLQNISLEHNDLASIDSWVFNALSSGRSMTISFSGNMISFITNSLGLKKPCPPLNPWLGTLDLGSNNITHIKPLFASFQNLSEFDILTCWSEHNGPEVILAHNPFICDCIDSRFYLLFRLIHSGQFSNLFCKGPSKFYKRRITTIPLQEFVCHIQDRCPEGCDCTYIPYQMTMKVECKSQYSLTEIPMDLPPLKMHNDLYDLQFTRTNITRLGERPYLNRTGSFYLNKSKIKNISLHDLYVFVYLNHLSLTGNKLSKLPEGISNFSFNPKATIYFAGNPWNCDCHFIETRKWMIKHKYQIADAGEIKCIFPERFRDRSPLSLGENEMICGDPPNTKLWVNIGMGAGGFSCAIIIFIIPISVIYFRRVCIYKTFKWHPFERDECLGEDKEFDIFVSFASEDTFVDDYLIPELERRDYHVCYHRLHFPPGEPITSSIERCINQSKRTLVFFTESFLASHWCMWEFSVALTMDQNQGTHRLVAILGENVDLKYCDPTIKTYFKKYTYVNINSRHFWDHLTYALPQNKTGTEENPPRSFQE